MISSLITDVFNLQAFASILIMFLINWGYALANISLALLVYIYIGQANPGLSKGRPGFSFVITEVNYFENLLSEESYALLYIIPMWSNFNIFQPFDVRVLYLQLFIFFCFGNVWISCFANLVQPKDSVAWGLAQLNLRQEVWIQTKMGFYCGNLARKASHSTTSPSVIVRSNSNCSHHLLQT